MDDKEALWAGAMCAERQGDAAAYEWLLKDIAATIRGILRARLHRMRFDPTEAEDVVQEILIGVHDKRHTWDERRAFVPWLASIMRYKFIDATRRLGRERARSVSIDTQEWARMITEANTDAATAIAVAQQINGLPEHQRDIVTALAVEGHTVRDVSRRTDRSEAAVRVTFNRALRRLFDRSRAERE